MGTTPPDKISFSTLSPTRLHAILSILRTCSRANHPVMLLFTQNQEYLLSHSDELTRILAFCVLCSHLSDETSLLSLWDLNIVEEYGSHHALRMSKNSCLTPSRFLVPGDTKMGAAARPSTSSFFCVRRAASTTSQHLSVFVYIA